MAPNGFDGWLCYTSDVGILRTLDALNTAGCSRVAVLVEKALAVAGIDPANMSDEAREARLEKSPLPDEQKRVVDAAQILISPQQCAQ